MRASFLGAVLVMGMLDVASGQSPTTPEVSLHWSIDGGPYGSSRSLEQTMAANTTHVYISGNVTKGDRRHQVIRIFDAASGKISGTIEHPTGAPFDGLGEAISLNDRYMVTSLHRTAGADEAGALLVYDTNTNTLLHQIDNPRKDDTAQFGIVPPALHDDRILASVTVTDDNVATAWVFDAKTGEVVLTLAEPDVRKPLLGKPKRSFFGRALAMNGTHIAITANDPDGPAGISSRGIVYVFDANDGALVHRLRTPGGDKAFGFGTPLKIVDNMLYVGGSDETGPLNWPTGFVHAYDLSSGELKFSISDPGVPKTLDEFSSGKQGWGFSSDIQVADDLLFSGIPHWAGTEVQQGGLMIFDAKTGALLFTYAHQTGVGSDQFGQSLATGAGGVAVSQRIGKGAETATRVMFLKVN